MKRSAFFSPPSFTRFRPIILPVLIFSFICLLMSFFAVLHVDPHHDGILLKPALDVSQGKILFKDSFHQYGALTAFLQAAVLKVFGPSLLYLRLSVVVSYGLTGTLLYAIWKRFLSSTGALIGVVLWFPTAYFLGKGVTVPFLPWSSAYALLTQSAAILFLFWWREKRLLRHLAWAGVMAALTFWFRQPVGILLAIAIPGIIIAICYLERSLKVVQALIVYLSGLIIASAPFLIYFVLNHALTEWWQQSIILSSDFGNRLSNNYSIFVIIRTIFPPFLSAKTNLIWFALPASVLLTGLWILYRFWQKRQLTQKEQLISILSVICLASWGQYFPVSDTSHWFWGATPMIGVMIFIIYLINKSVAKWCISHLKKKLQPSVSVPKIALAMTVIILSIIYLPTLYSDWRGVRMLFSHPYARAQHVTVLQGMYIEPAEQQLYDAFLTRTNSYFSVYPNKTYINLSPDALYSTLDPHFVQMNQMPMYWDWTAQTLYPDFLQQVDTYVDKHRPLIISRDVTDFSNYCSINLALSSPIQIEIYSRPLLVLTPVEDLLKVTRKSSTTYQVTPQVGDVTIQTVTLFHPTEASQSATLDKKIPAHVSGMITVPWHASQTRVQFEFASSLYGKCVYRLP